MGVAKLRGKRVDSQSVAVTIYHILMTPGRYDSKSADKKKKKNLSVRSYKILVENNCDHVIISFLYSCINNCYPVQIKFLGQMMCDMILGRDRSPFCIMHSNLLIEDYKEWEDQESPFFFLIIH